MANNYNRNSASTQGTAYITLTNELKAFVKQRGFCLGQLGQGTNAYYCANINPLNYADCGFYIVYANSLDFALQTLANYFCRSDFRYRKLDITSYEIYCSSFNGYCTFLFP